MGKLSETIEYWLGPNWRTTLNGLVAFIGLCVAEIAAEYDTSWLRIAARVIAAAGIINGFRQTRDKKVSDQESGIPPERTSQKAFAKYIEKHGSEDYPIV